MLDIAAFCSMKRYEYNVRSMLYRSLQTSNGYARTLENSDKGVHIAYYRRRKPQITAGGS
ncbi:MAG: hypothetical protein ACUVR2_03290 [Anaerolineae bacterium]